MFTIKTLFLRKARVFFCVWFLLAFGISQAYTPPPVLPFTADLASSSYIKDCSFTLYYVHPFLQDKNINFNEQEVSVPIKGVYFSNWPLTTEIRYSEIDSFTIGDYRYTIIVYNRFGEGDAYYLNIQINSYDTDGTLIDALLLDSRYAFEDGESFRDYVIEEDGNIGSVLYFAHSESNIKNRDSANIKPSAYAAEQFKLSNYPSRY